MHLSNYFLINFIPIDAFKKMNSNIMYINIYNYKLTYLNGVCICYSIRTR